MKKILFIYRAHLQAFVDKATHQDHDGAVGCIGCDEYGTYRRVNGASTTHIEHALENPNE